MTADTQNPVAGGTVGRNGVRIEHRSLSDGERGFRTYEVYQRERVGESTEKIKNRELISEDFQRDPYPLLEILRENYPCYRDWLNNCYWITRYNDVTSIFTDEANFETRSKRWTMGLAETGRNLSDALPVLEAEQAMIDAHAEPVAERLIDELAAPEDDLATGFAARFALELLAERYGIETQKRDEFFSLYWRAQRGVSWRPDLRRAGIAAFTALQEFLTPIVEQRRAQPGEDMISAMLQVDTDVHAGDVAATLLEADHETIHGATANLWLRLLTHPQELDKARSERRLMKLAYLETLRHAAPVLSARRFARHEVERFGRLIPEGALLLCSAGAANRDPRIFNDPDKFIVDRKDLCQREPRGQYRADGLATGIAFALGPPSKHPAVPEDRPRSRYAIVRDAVVNASWLLAQKRPDLRLQDNAAPELRALSLGEMHTCWSLPVRTG